jgi:hypothetical protein
MGTVEGNAGGDRRGPLWDVIGGRREPPPAAVLLGWELEAVDPDAGTIELSFAAREEFLNPSSVPPSRDDCAAAGVW